MEHTVKFCKIALVNTGKTYSNTILSIKIQQSRRPNTFYLLKKHNISTSRNDGFGNYFYRKQCHKNLGR